MEPYLSVVIPAYNEEERLKRFVPGIVEFLQSKRQPFEIIVVNDGSKDSTAQVTENLAKTYPLMRLISLNPNRGKGGAVRTGMLAALGRYVLFTDADQSTPITEVDKLLTKLEREGYDVAIGSRAARGAQVGRHQAWHRELAARVFNLARICLTVRGVADTQCGFKCMKREVAQKVFPRVSSDTAIFDIEMLILIAREGFRVAELPVTWVHDPDTRIPYNLRRALCIWGELFRIRRAQRVGWPARIRS